MTIKEALLFGEQRLAKLELPHLDAAVLLALVTKKPKIFIYAHDEKPLAGQAWQRYQQLIHRRTKHEPVAYLIGVKEFYGRKFVVNKNVLIPRPETELLIEEVKKIHADLIIDVGTGSGAIAVTLALETKRPVIAIDRSCAALNIAKQNARRHHADQKIKFISGDLLTPIKKKLKGNLLVVANLPYLPTDRKKTLPPEIKKYEPMLALLGGPDGLTLYRRLLEQIKKLSLAHWTLVAEIDSLQEKLFKKMTFGLNVTFKKDLSGSIRVAIVKNT